MMIQLTRLFLIQIFFLSSLFLIPKFVMAAGSCVNEDTAGCDECATNVQCSLRVDDLGNPFFCDLNNREGTFCNIGCPVIYVDFCGQGYNCSTENLSTSDVFGNIYGRCKLEVAGFCTYDSDCRPDEICDSMMCVLAPGGTPDDEDSDEAADEAED